MIPLTLKFIQSVDASGVPELAEENRRVISVQKFRMRDVGQLAVCQAVETEQDAILVLGVLNETPPEHGAISKLPLVIRCGQASLTLAPDGSIRMDGTSFGLRTRGAVRINGAIVELN